MSEHEERVNSILKWATENTPDREKLAFIDGYMACTKRKDAELAALRGFAMFIFLEGFYGAELEVRGLTDENGNPTKLLTGE